MAYPDLHEHIKALEACGYLRRMTGKPGEQMGTNVTHIASELVEHLDEGHLFLLLQEQFRYFTTGGPASYDDDVFLLDSFLQSFHVA